jgi:primosomal protein N' (replication factor Y)
VTGDANGPALVGVAVPIPLRKTFTYRVPHEKLPDVHIGSRVRVPLGKRSVKGTVVACPAAQPEPGVEVKDLSEALPASPSLDGHLLALTQFVADYYLCSWGEAIEAALPPDPPPHKRPRRAETAAPEAPLPAPVAGPAPTPAQAGVLRSLIPAVGARAFTPFLLWGATGSGKTEVYLRAAEAALSAGRGVLYLVPEIGLTPLLVSRIEARFPGQVAVLHSAVPTRHRRMAWEAVRAGAKRFVVGARSAVFAPLPDVGLVIVDEEHDPSYKQQDAPRYNGRDVAVFRARLAGAPVVLGSATPSVESFQHARSGRYTLLSLGGRVENRPLPAVRLVDMREEFRRRGEVTPISADLADALVACIGRGEQALILRNRRGWAAAILCPACGQRLTCRLCSLALTWHKKDRRLRCHACAGQHPLPTACPSCGGPELRELGEGTERIEDEIARIVPGAKVARMDRDTVSGRGAHEKILRSFDTGEVDVLVGTQMIAKGHDFPRVTLVGVLAADHALGLPDFRAGERAFQLLTQVAGRAGRGSLPGVVIAQAFDPSHPVLAHAARQDYESFFSAEMRYRRALRYPPLAALVQIIVSDPREGQAWRVANDVAAALGEATDGRLTITGPGPAPIEKLRGSYRMQILVRSAGRRKLVDTVAAALAPFEPTAARRAIHVDVDPVSLL